jgi:P-type Cu+ transporter
MKRTLRVDGMTCANCAKTLERTFEPVEHVSVKVNVSAGRLLLDYNDAKIGLPEIASLVRQAGYTPVLGQEETEKHGFTEQVFRRDILISLLLTIPLLWTMWHHFGATWMTPRLSMFLMQPAVQFALATPVQFYVGRIFYRGFLKSLRQRVLGMDALVVLGTSSAYAYSMWVWISSNTFWHSMGHMMDMYFETSATIITMILIGNYFEHLAKKRTSSALEELLNLQAKVATVVRDGVEHVISIEDVLEGDIILVKPLERIPVDGLIVTGESFIDESMISGESIPVYKQVGERVIGATINQSQQLWIQATHIGEDTVLAKIIQTVEEVSASKPPIQRTADKISSIFVPLAISIAVGTFVVWYVVLGAELSLAVRAAVAVLVISCPCPLGLATPTSILVGSGLAAKTGILYKGGEFFETANQIDAIAFDKTGTLTLGQPKVTDWVGNQEYLPYIASVEHQSVHPLSQAIASLESTTLLEVTNFETVGGKGVQGHVNGQPVIIGNARLMTESGIDISSVDDQAKDYLAQGKTLVYASVDGVLQMLFAIQDQLKPDAKATIAALHRRGIETFMITGDHPEVAKAIAREVGIANVHAGVLPDEKASIVTSIQNQGYFVAFVGDGINDAIALKAANVGFSMSNGSDVAIESSDVTLLAHNLHLVNQAIDVSKATLRNIYQNFGWAFSYNIVAIPMAAMGLLSPTVAAVAMSFSSITVVMNALRLKRMKLEVLEGGDLMADVTIQVPDMDCNHCVKTIETALTTQKIQAKVDLGSKSVSLDAAHVDQAMQTIANAGYTPSKQTT